MVHNIAIVDDEEQILDSIKWVFMNDPYNVFTFQSPTKALEELMLEEIAVVVSDLMMPEMDGVAFIKEVKERCPDVECIIMTAYQSSPLIKEINFPVIAKPWNIIDFKTLIAEAIARYESRMKIISQCQSHHKQTNPRI